MSPPSVSRQHADWLSLVEASGPFVSLPVLMRAFPQGLDARDPLQAKALREAYEGWQDNPTVAGTQRAWLMHVLCALLGYPANQIAEGQSLPAGLEARMPEMGETLRPDLALVGPLGTDDAGQAQLLIVAYPSEQALNKPVTGRHWKATPATRMMELLHGAGVPLGLVTNGEQWMLVYAPPGEVTGYTSWYASLWLDEPITLRAFHSLLGVRRFFGVAADGSLQALLKESSSDQQEVTDQLGYQVREAVEVLVQSFDALDKESDRKLLKGVSPSAQYDAALTVMMRLVFLFSAEERGLLHLGKPLYDDNYAVSTLQEQLQEVADQHGEEVLERRCDAWARLLASFRAVHGGIRHQDLLMQAYGGSLFDPDRYAFLEGRAAGSQWRNVAGDPLAVNNRVVLHLLNSLQRLRIKGGAGGVTETRRVSFRALGVEQIGHVYEGLLDHTAVRASEPVLGIKGTRNKESEIALARLESLLAMGQDKLIEFLKDETGRSASAIRRSLDEGGVFDEHRLRVACNQDEVLLARLRPFAGLIRDDSFEQPMVVLNGSVFVTAGSTRRSTGAHYTPPSLTEPIVQHTLEPLVYVGPAEGLPRDQWRLKAPKEILSLKVCDMTMGSGAFLVQACRYLAERLTEAWEIEEGRHPGEVLITPDGEFSGGDPSERLVPADADERIAIARRVVADRCLYGVDVNPMAVEMAKLSLWLITVDAHRPFTFLDHALKCGDSLLGITSLEQLQNFSMRPGAGMQQAFSTPELWRHIDDAKKKREAIEAMPSDLPEQILAKSALHAEAEIDVAKLSAVADVVAALELKGLKGRAYEIERAASSEHAMERWVSGKTESRGYALKHLGGRHCFHWPLAFPEISSSGGFSAFVGNPPFMGGRKISTNIGADYLDYLLLTQDRVNGIADLVCHFFRRCYSLLSNSGCMGLISTNSISEVDSRRSSLEPIRDDGGIIYKADNSKPWPGQAAVVVSVVHIAKNWTGKAILDGAAVEDISSSLGVQSQIEDPPKILASNLHWAHSGSKIMGDGFKLNRAESDELVGANSSSSDLIRHLLGGADITESPTATPSRLVIDPGQRSEAEVRKYPEIFARLTRLVYPSRSVIKDVAKKKYWWRFAGPSSALYKSIAGLEYCLVCCRVAKYVMFEISPTNSKLGPIVFDESVVAIAFGDHGTFSLLQSSLHSDWVDKWGSRMGTAPRYTATEVLENFPFPPNISSLADIGKRYREYRSEVKKLNNEGLTGTYNRVHNPSEVSHEISTLRSLSTEMDLAVARAYGWQDIDLGHGFHETRQGIRFTVSSDARKELLDRLLGLNHQRHAASASVASVTPIKSSRKLTISEHQTTLDM